MRARMRLVTLLVFAVLTAACLQPLRRYRVGPMPTATEPHLELARAMTSAGLEIDEVNPTLGLVSSRWVAPFGNDWRRRFVAIVDREGMVSLRVELKICRPFQPCVPIQEAVSQDLEALDAVANELGKSLHVPVGVEQPTEG